jgi:uncharacterized protein (DUF433 family)
MSDRYQYLWVRPHPWRRQASLKGRSMTVGQLIATMRADRMSPEEAATDLALPLEQILEAIAYYEAHHDLVDAELREEGRRLRAKGYVIDPPPVPR